MSLNTFLEKLCAGGIIHVYLCVGHQSGVLVCVQFRDSVLQHWEKSSTVHVSIPPPSPICRCYVYSTVDNGTVYVDEGI